MARGPNEKKSKGGEMIYFKRIIKWGNITVAIDENIKIAGLWFEGQKYFPNIPEDACWIEDASKKDHPCIDRDYIQKTIKLIKEFDLQMKNYEEGKMKTFDLPLAPAGSEFRQMVWKELLKIPIGTTTSYGKLGTRVARQSGKKTMSAQAVGGAVGHNPISLIIPCHRVVGANGKLTGYAGGIDKKTAILKHEGAII